MAQGQTESPPRDSTMYLSIEDYAVIGDLHTVALVGKNGSIDWCCLPRFDSPSVFGAILDAKKGGYFRIAPPDTPGMGHKQLYPPETNILITRFLMVDGVGEITDFMPIKQEGTSEHLHHLVRSVAVVRGSLPWKAIVRHKVFQMVSTRQLFRKRCITGRIGFLSANIRADGVRWCSAPLLSSNC